jgi:hypothetical protein
MSRYAKRFVRKIVGPSDNGMEPESTDAKEALVILSHYLLGDDFVITDPMSSEQAITVVTNAILERYSHQYRRDIRKEVKRRITEETIKLAEAMEFFTEG